MMELHPATVHFPVALLITGGISWMVALIRKEGRFRQFGFWLHTLGLAGVGLAIITGNLELPLDINEKGQATLDYHQTLSYVIAWLFAMLWIWVFMRGASMSPAEGWTFTAVYWVCLSFVFWTSWLGGKLVYEHGAGVSP